MKRSRWERDGIYDADDYSFFGIVEKGQEREKKDESKIRNNAYTDFVNLYSIGERKREEEKAQET